MTTKKARQPNKSKSDLFLEAAVKFDDVVIITHDNPDPDALACGWALTELLRQKTGKNSRLVARGAVMRAENKLFLKLLKPPLELIDSLIIPPHSFVVLVDCQPAAPNHIPLNSAIFAVIDHHERVKELGYPTVFFDIRPSVTASTSGSPFDPKGKDYKSPQTGGSDRGL